MMHMPFFTAVKTSTESILVHSSLMSRYVTLILNSPSLSCTIATYLFKYLPRSLQITDYIYLYTTPNIELPPMSTHVAKNSARHLLDNLQ